MGFVVAPLENFSIKSTGYLMRKQPFLYRRHQLFNMHVRGYIAVAGFAVTVVLGACASEVRTPEPDSETGPEASAALACPTPVSVTALPPQQDFATDIRTVLTGVKSPVQQEALAQAGKIAPGQMSDALCGVLVDEAAFVSYLDHRDDTGDPRLDSLAHFLVCALQPHFSQEELAADLISLTSDDEYLEPVRRARQITAAWLAMHLPAGDMGEELQRAAIKANEYLIGSDLYPMYTAQGFLFEALFKQYAGYSDADFSAEIARGRTCCRGGVHSANSASSAKKNTMASSAGSTRCVSRTGGHAFPAGRLLPAGACRLVTARTRCQDTGHYGRRSLRDMWIRTARVDISAISRHQRGIACRGHYQADNVR